jgi:hypothetical protein
MLLIFQNLGNLINVLIKNIYLSVSYDFLKFDMYGKSWCDIPRGTTQGWVCPHLQP